MCPDWFLIRLSVAVFASSPRACDEMRNAAASKSKRGPTPASALVRVVAEPDKCRAWLLDISARAACNRPAPLARLWRCGGGGIRIPDLSVTLSLCKWSDYPIDTGRLGSAAKRCNTAGSHTSKARATACSTARTIPEPAPASESDPDIATSYLPLRPLSWRYFILAARHTSFPLYAKRLLSLFGALSPSQLTTNPSLCCFRFRIWSISIYSPLARLYQLDCIRDDTVKLDIPGTCASKAAAATSFRIARLAITKLKASVSLMGNSITDPTGTTSKLSLLTRYEIAMRLGIAPTRSLGGLADRTGNAPNSCHGRHPKSADLRVPQCCRSQQRRHKIRILRQNASARYLS